MLKDFINLSHLSSNRDTVRNKNMSFLFTTGDK